VRPEEVKTAGGKQNFNPHTREGCDTKDILCDFYVLYISIHTPAKGATGKYIPKRRRERDFNPHTREGCDANALGIGFGIDFNPHTREGCD